MRKITVWVFCLCAWWPSVYAQVSGHFARTLQEIESNNLELQAMRSFTDAQIEALKAQNRLPDPQLGGYLMPWGNHSTEAYTEWEITQSFEFPTVYAKRKLLQQQQKAVIEQEYSHKRQQILLEAARLYIETAYLSKWLEAEKERTGRAQKVHEQMQTLYDKGQVGVLDLNKARVSWMQDQFKVGNIESQINVSMKKLSSLNGGNEFSSVPLDYPENLSAESMESLWEEKSRMDPVLVALKMQEELALRQFKLAKNQWLPNLTAGFNRQGTPGMVYSGLYGGISIPLWSQRHKANAARAQWDAGKALVRAQNLERYADFEAQFTEYQRLQEQFLEYQETMQNLNSEELLLKAYQLGEISFMEYYMETGFYHKALDTMLEMEKQINLLKADLLKHQLLQLN